MKPPRPANTSILVDKISVERAIRLFFRTSDKNGTAADIKRAYARHLKPSALRKHKQSLARRRERRRQIKERQRLGTKRQRSGPKSFYISRG